MASTSPRYFSRRRTFSIWRSHRSRRPRVSPTLAQPPPRVGARRASFWREYLRKLPSAILVALAGAYAHAVSSYRILDRGQIVILLFAASTVAIKSGLQEYAKRYVIKKGVRSIRTMCVLVGVPTVLIGTQTRIVMVGTQTNTFLMIETVGMSIVEVGMRTAKAVSVIWTIRRQTKVVQEKLIELSRKIMQAEVTRHTMQPPLASSASLKTEFELWRQQVLSYYTAERTADMYAEYISIGCSQSIMFWFADHPHYPALQFGTTTTWRLGKLGMLVFQFVVEVLVDYICLVIELAVGLESDRLLTQIFVVAERERASKSSSRRQALGRTGDEIETHDTISLIELIQASYSVFGRYGIGPPDDAVYHRYLLSLSIDPERDWRKKILNFDLDSQPRVKRLCSGAGCQHGAAVRPNVFRYEVGPEPQSFRRHQNDNRIRQASPVLRTSTMTSPVFSPPYRNQNHAQHDRFGDMLTLDSPLQRFRVGDTKSQQTKPAMAASSPQPSPVELENDLKSRLVAPMPELVSGKADNGEQSNSADEMPLPAPGKKSAEARDRVLAGERQLQMITTSIDQWRATQAVKQLVNQNKLQDRKARQQQITVPLCIHGIFRWVTLCLPEKIDFRAIDSPRALPLCILRRISVDLKIFKNSAKRVWIWQLRNALQQWHRDAHAIKTFRVRIFVKHRAAILEAAFQLLHFGFVECQKLHKFGTLVLYWKILVANMRSQHQKKLNAEKLRDCKHLKVSKVCFGGWQEYARKQRECRLRGDLVKRSVRDYGLMLLAWKAWGQKLWLRNVARLADGQLQKCQKSKVVRTWKLFVHETHQRHQRDLKVVKTLSKLHINSCFQGWKRAVVSKHQLVAYTEAVQRTMRRRWLGSHWKLWREALKINRGQHERLSAVASRRQNRQLYASFQSWKTIWLIRKRHRQLLQLTLATTNQRQLEAHFDAWKKSHYAASAREYRTLEAQSRLLQFKARRAITFWSFLHQAEQNRSCLLAKSLALRRQNLLASGFRRLLQHTQTRRMVKAQGYQAESFHRRHLMRLGFFGWSRWFQSQEQVEMKLHKTKCRLEWLKMKRAIQLLKLNVQLRKKLRTAHATVVAIGTGNAKTMSFMHWKTFIFQKHNNKRIDADRAASMRHFRMRNRIQLWGKFVQARKMMKLMSIRAAKASTASLLQAHFKAWKVFVDRRVFALALKKKAVAFRYFFLLPLHFRAWKAFLLSRNRALAQVFAEWKECIKIRAQQLRGIEKRFALLWMTDTQATIFARWKRFAQLHGLIRRKLAGQREITLYNVVQLWRVAVISKRQTRQLALFVSERSRLYLKRVCFNSWRIEARMLHRAKTLCSKLTESRTTTNLCYRLRRWKQFTLQSVAVKRFVRCRDIKLMQLVFCAGFQKFADMKRNKRDLVKRIGSVHEAFLKEWLARKVQHRMSIIAACDNIRRTGWTKRLLTAVWGEWINFHSRKQAQLAAVRQLKVQISRLDGRENSLDAARFAVMLRRWSTVKVARVFEHWRNVIKSLKQARFNSLKAIQLWHKLQCERFFLGWVRFCQEQRIRRRIRVMNVRSKLKRSWSFWQMYVVLALGKKATTLAARQMHEKHLCHNAFETWKLTAISLRLNREQIIELYHSSRLRLLAALLSEWRQFSAMEKTKRMQTTVARVVYEDKLKRKNFIEWKTNVVEICYHRRLLQINTERLQILLLCSSFRAWHSWSLQHEKHRSILEVLSTQRTVRAATLVFTAWHFYTEKNAGLRNQVLSFSRFHRMTKGVKALRIMVEEQQYLGTIRQKAQLFRSTTSTWIRSRESRKEFRALQEQIQARVQLSIQRQCLENWKHFVAVQKVENAMLLMSTAFARTRLAKQVLMCWRKFIVYSCATKEKIRNALVYMQLQCQFKAFRALRYFMLQRKWKAHIDLQVLEFRSKRLKTQSFSKWRTVVVERVDRLQKLARYLAAMQNSVQKKIVGAWYAHTARQKLLREKVSRSLELRRIMSSRMVLQAWRIFVTKARKNQKACDFSVIKACAHAIKHWKQYVVLCKVERMIGASYLRQVESSFLLWRKAVAVTHQIRAFEAKAAQRHWVELVGMVFKVWKQRSRTHARRRRLLANVSVGTRLRFRFMLWQKFTVHRKRLAALLVVVADPPALVAPAGAIKNIVAKESSKSMVDGEMVSADSIESKLGTLEDIKTFQTDTDNHELVSLGQALAKKARLLQRFETTWDLPQAWHRWRQIFHAQLFYRMPCNQRTWRSNDEMSGYGGGGFLRVWQAAVKKQRERRFVLLSCVVKLKSVARKRVLQVIFGAWKQHVERETRCRVALLKYDRGFAKRALSSWLETTKAQQRRKQQLESATNYHSQRLKSTVFFYWQTYALAWQDATTKSNTRRHDRQLSLPAKIVAEPRCSNIFEDSDDSDVGVRRPTSPVTKFLRQKNTSSNTKATAFPITSQLKASLLFKTTQYRQAIDVGCKKEILSSGFAFEPGHWFTAKHNVYGNKFRKQRSDDEDDIDVDQFNLHALDDASDDISQVDV
ncbi:unnamed protein product [Phytophthora fragariaefolia]|uniref:Unnamed protein product n=1 Tax=Phytophthora fragariaefolia TaxID=1490495 RepID=A0A9W7DCN2_9STRA|nr:unnamed protein product [Phytophthora fragariaefolia]